MKVFFVKYNDPIYVKLEKLDIMIRLASQANIAQVTSRPGRRPSIKAPQISHLFESLLLIQQISYHLVICCRCHACLSVSL